MNKEAKTAKFKSLANKYFEEPKVEEWVEYIEAGEQNIDIEN
jgi:hypothetical protein